MGDSERGRAAWRWCVASGCLAFLCSWLFGRIPGLVACGPSHGLGPIIAFELARSPSEVAALFGSDPCRSTLVGAQKTGLLLDAFGFIPSYTAFLIFAARAAAGAWRWHWMIVAALLIAGLCDEIEGGLLYAILLDLPGTTGLLGALFWAVHIKFALLGLGTLAIGGVVVMSPRFFAKLLGLFVAIGAGNALYCLATAQGSAMMGGFTRAWVGLLVTALIFSIWPSLFSPARAAPPPRRAPPTL